MATPTVETIPRRLERLKAAKHKDASMMIKQIIIPVVTVFTLIGCASKMPNLSNPVEMGTMKEYDSKVAIKDLGNSPEATTSALKDDGKPIPKLGLEPIIKKELKGRKKKKIESNPMTPPEVSATDAKRLPEIEDSVGFNGRRPIVDPFHVGEKVTLMLTYFGVSAGDATLELRPFAEVNGRKAYHFYSKLTSSSVFAMFYRVDDFAESYMDFEQMVPLNFTMSVKESKQLREVRTFFDWKTQKANFWEQRVTSEDGKKETKKSWDLVPFAQNVYTALHYFRTFQLEDGKTYSYHVSDDGNTWDVHAKVLRREILKTDLGNFKTVVISPEVATNGILKPMGEVLFWFTDDDRKFPVKFEAKIKIGKVVGYLKALEKGNP